MHAVCYYIGDYFSYCHSYCHHGHGHGRIIKLTFGIFLIITSVVCSYVQLHVIFKIDITVATIFVIFKAVLYRTTVTL